jgi:hypothetical protein
MILEYIEGSIVEEYEGAEFRTTLDIDSTSEEEVAGMGTAIF